MGGVCVGLMRPCPQMGNHMRISWWASFLHKWLAVIVGLQIVIWICTGLFFSLVPIERVRSEHRMRTLPPAVLQSADVSAFPALFDGAGRAPTRVTVDNRPEGPRAVVEYEGGGGALFDLRTGAKLSPLNADDALQIARARIVTDAPAKSTTRVTTESTEYRGALPAWRIVFDEPEHLAVYVGAETGHVTARRSALWRVYDTLWSLHIMDYRDHENFNNWPLIVVSTLALASVFAGIALVPYRFRWRRKKRAASEAA